MSCDEFLPFHQNIYAVVRKNPLEKFMFASFYVFVIQQLEATAFVKQPKTESVKRKKVQLEISLAYQLMLAGFNMYYFICPTKC